MKPQPTRLLVACSVMSTVVPAARVPVAAIGVGLSAIVEDPTDGGGVAAAAGTIPTTAIDSKAALKATRARPVLPVGFISSPPLPRTPQTRRDVAPWIERPTHRL